MRTSIKIFHITFQLYVEAPASDSPKGARQDVFDFIARFETKTFSSVVANVYHEQLPSYL